MAPQGLPDVPAELRSQGRLNLVAACLLERPLHGSAAIRVPGELPDVTGDSRDTCLGRSCPGAVGVDRPLTVASGKQRGQLGLALQLLAQEVYVVRRRPSSHLGVTGGPGRRSLGVPTFDGQGEHHQLYYNSSQQHQSQQQLSKPFKRELAASRRQ